MSRGGEKDLLLDVDRAPAFISAVPLSEKERLANVEGTLKTVVVRTNCDLFWKIAAVTAVLLTLSLVIASMFFTGGKDAIHRISIEARPENVVGGTGEPGAFVYGMLELNSAQGSFTYSLRNVGNTSGITRVALMGPIVSTTYTGPLLTVLCGAPTTACDITTTAGELNGSVDLVYNGVLPAPIGKDVVNQIRDKPFLYYMEILTNLRPTPPGAVRDTLAKTSGYK